MKPKNTYPGYFSYHEAKHTVSVCFNWEFAVFRPDRLQIIAKIRGAVTDVSGKPPAIPATITSDESYDRVRKAAAVKVGTISDDSLFELMRLCRGYSRRPATITAWDESDLYPQPHLRDQVAAISYLNSLPLPVCFMERAFRFGRDEIWVLIEALGGLDYLLSRLTRTEQRAFCRRLTLYAEQGMLGPYGWKNDFARNPYDQIVELAQVTDAHQQAVETVLERGQLTVDAANYFQKLLLFRPALNELFAAADAALVTYGTKSEQVKPG